MKRKATIIGIGHMAGTSKEGKSYDFYEAHYTYEDSSIDGFGCGHIIIPDDVASTVVLGEIYDIFSHYYRGNEYFDALLKAIRS